MNSRLIAAAFVLTAALPLSGFSAEPDNSLATAAMNRKAWFCLPVRT